MEKMENGKKKTTREGKENDQINQYDIINRVVGKTHVEGEVGCGVKGGMSQRERGRVDARR